MLQYPSDAAYKKGSDYISLTDFCVSDDFFKPIKTGHVHMEQIITNQKKQEIKMIFPIGERQFLEKKMPTFWEKKTKKSRRTSEAKNRYHSGSRCKNPIIEHS